MLNGRQIPSLMLLTTSGETSYRPERKISHVRHMTHITHVCAVDGNSGKIVGFVTLYGPEKQCLNLCKCKCTCKCMTDP